jgi:hypothetical protein
LWHRESSAFKIFAKNPTVVDLPFVPVIKIGGFASLFNKHAKSPGEIFSAARPGALVLRGDNVRANLAARMPI